MKKITLLLALFAFTLVAKAQYPQTLPITFSSFTATAAMGTDPTLVKDAYPTVPVTFLPNEWTNFEQVSYVSPTVEVSTLSYSNYVDNNLGKAIVLTQGAASATRFYTSYGLTSGSEYTGKPFYISALINFSTVANGNAFLMINTNSWGNSSRGKLMPFSVTGGYTLGLQWASETPAGGALGSTVFSFGTTYLVVLKVTPAATGNETVSLFVIPTIGGIEPLTPEATITNVAAIKAIKGISLRATVAGKIAGLRFSDNWTDVVKPVLAPTITSFTPTSAVSGTTVTITGTNFIGATAVSFGGIAATSYSVASATSITAVVASGTSGNVSVTTPGGVVIKTGFSWVIDYNSFSAASAMGTDPALIKEAYAVPNTSPIIPNEWTGTVSGGPTVQASTLSYSNYVDNNAGKAVLTDGNRSIATYSLTSSTTAYTGKPFYFSILINFSSIKTGDAFIFFCKDYWGTYSRGKIYPITNGTGYSLGVQSSGETVVYGTRVLNMNQTYLVVIKVSPAVSGTEYISVFVNPTIDGTEPVTPEATTSAAFVLQRIQGLVVRTTPTGSFGGFRFSDTWAEVVKGRTTVSTSQNSSDLSLTASSVVTVASGGTLTFNSSATVNSITIARGGKVTNNSGSTLSATNFSINSDASGTGTYIDKGTTNISGTASVQQYMTAGRNWYISSPVSSASSSILPAGTLWKYNEPNTGVTGSPGSATWDYVSTPETMVAMTGYIFKPTSTATVTFSGGALNTGDKTITVYRTENGQAKRGFNLIGNPYPSYINWMSAIDVNNTGTTNLLTSIWYRTQNTASTPGYVFDTYNETGGIGTNNNQTGAVTGLIPPMQSFWVRVKSTGSNTSGTLKFTNLMRAHKDVSTNNFRAPSAKNATQQVLHLQVSNGMNSDETIILFNPSASNSYDDFDSPKMTNSSASIPEIYTLLGTEQMVINGMSSISYNTELPIGFTTAQSNSFTIKAIEINNFEPGTEIILKDYLNPTNVVEWNLTDGSAYTFASDVAANSSRFTLMFKSPLFTTGLNSIDGISDRISVARNGNNQITVYYNGNMNSQSTVSVYNAMGQKLAAKQLKNTVTVFDNTFVPGVYLVTVVNAGKTVTKRVVID